MSATNRGGLARQPNDFYETPEDTIDAILDVLGIGPAFDGYVVDACCGTGAIARRIAERAPKADIRGIDFDSTLLEQARASCSLSNVTFELANWLSWEPDGPVDLVIANPPYQAMHWDPGKIVNKGKPNERVGGWVVDDKHLAEKCIRKALQVVGKKGTVVMLLRDNYLVPKTRAALEAAFGKPDLLRLEKRPSFNGSGTDACDYAWHVWGQKRVGRYDVLRARET